jgi:iduronate 2-sulfatase
LLDIYPTLIDICRLSPRPELDGMSLRPLMLDPQLPWDRGAVTVYGAGNTSVRTSRWRYIHYRDKTKELYDHDTDPNEFTNLAATPGYMPVINSLHQWVPQEFAPPAPFYPSQKSFFDSAE